MKVLIISAFPPDPAPEANHALHLAEHLADAGVSVDVLCKQGSIASTRPDITVHPLMRDWSWTDLPRLAQALRDTRPDVVLLLYIGWVFDHHPMITFLPTVCRRVLPGVPCVTQFENIDEGAPRHGVLTRAARRTMKAWAGSSQTHRLFGTLTRDSARIIVLSSPHRARLAKRNGDVEEKCVILPPPPLIRFCADAPAIARKRARKEIGAEPDAFVWMYWGYVYPGKGIETLLRAFRLALASNPRLRLALVGGSLDFPAGSSRGRDYLDKVRQLATHLGIDERVTWTGSFTWDSDAGSRYLHAADAVVLPFDYGVTLNNSSLAAAASHGLPVLATELAQGRDVMLEHGRNIYLCRPEEPDTLAEALQLISTNDALRERLRNGAVQLAHDWHRWDSSTERLLGVLRSLRRSDVSAQAELPRPPTAGEPGLATARSRGPGDPAPEQESGRRPRVSVIVAAHNVAPYLSQCLDALTHQTLDDIEIIVVNDASSDTTGDVIQQYQAAHPNMRCITCEENVGLASVRNLGMRAARGHYVAFADGDDWVDVRMCETLYRRAEKDSADVVVADTHVFYEDTKTFTKFFDQHIRVMLEPELKVLPFNANHVPLVYLLEPVAWTKLYRRSFLEEHGLRFEDGMNSYEDVCFHFSVLFKAQRISLMDEPIAYYRQSRPGQISGRTSRKVFEVFAVFSKIQDNLKAWNAPDVVWAMLAKVQLRQFDWLLRDRVQRHHKREFLAAASQQLKQVPEAGYRVFATYASPHERLKFAAIRRNWLALYQRIARMDWPTTPLLRVLQQGPRRNIIKRGCRKCLKAPRRAVAAKLRAYISRSVNIGVVEHQLKYIHDSQSQLRDIVVASAYADPLVHVSRIGTEVLLLSTPDSKAGLPDAVWRVQQDYYLSQLAIFRPGDVVVDVGAHLGAFSLYLAKKYPFISVYALEPNPRHFACLERNIALNGLTNVVAINKAISGENGVTTLFTDPWDGRWASVDAKEAATHRTLQAVTIESATLDQIFDEHEISHCRLLKITAPGVIRPSLKGFARSACVDLLCGEADTNDCNRVTLEAESWRIARQHFWRLLESKAGGTAHAWIQEFPRSPSVEPAAAQSALAAGDGGQSA